MLSNKKYCFVWKSTYLLKVSHMISVYFNIVSVCCVLIVLKFLKCKSSTQIPFNNKIVPLIFTHLCLWWMLLYKIIHYQILAALGDSRLQYCLLWEKKNRTHCVYELKTKAKWARLSHLPLSWRRSRVWNTRVRTQRRSAWVLLSSGAEKWRLDSSSSSVKSLSYKLHS